VPRGEKAWQQAGRWHKGATEYGGVGGGGDGIDNGAQRMCGGRGAERTRGGGSTVRIEGLVRCRRWHAAGVGSRSSGRRHRASVVAAATSSATASMEMGGGLRPAATSMGSGC
jgi:hypothetical protein